MERFMYQDDSFEQVLKQKADEYRMYPSDQSWEIINRRLHHPNRFNRKAAAFFTATFLSISLWVSVNQHEVAVVNSALTEVLSEPLIVNETAAAEPSAIKQINNAGRERIVANSTQKEPATVSVVVSESTNFIIPATRPTETTISQNHAAIEEPSKEVNLKLTDAVALKNFSKLPGAEFISVRSISELMQPVPTATEIKIEEAEENKTDADLNYEVHVPVTVQTKKPKAELQLHIAPSASYRVLVSDNKFNFGNLRDPNSAVKQRTSIGMEAGVTFIKPVSKTISFTAGLQFNFTNYVLVSSRYNPELATVILNSARNVQRYTNLRTSNGYFAENITNKTYQLSVPIGVQMRLLQTKKFSWNLGTTLQPTYLINATGYLVTNDYKNYIKAPEFLRSLNLNYSLESFFRFNSGSSTQIIAGPQFRYQLFSNSKENYPVQEHLVDYGFRIGFIKTLK